MTCRCRVNLYWVMMAREPGDLLLGADGTPRTMYECDWRSCDLHRGSGVGYLIGDADALRAAASEYGGVFALLLEQAMAMPDPMPDSLRVYNNNLRRREAEREWRTSG